MKKTARMALVAGLACLALTACGERDDSNDGAAEPTTSETDSEATRSRRGAVPRLQGLHGVRLGRLRRQVVQPDLARRPDLPPRRPGASRPLRWSRRPTPSTPTTSTRSSHEGCNQITTVGFLLGDATEAAAKKNTDVDFAIIDFAYEKPPANLKGLTFDTAQPSYLAGYLAAAESESGVVGTFGGLNIPTVTIFMEGFRQGVDAYNEENGTEVKLLGWDGKDGSFTEDFEDKSKGQAIAEQMIQQGADIIFPVAGPAGLGGLQAAQDADARGIWVDTDGCVSAAEYCDILLTSVMKRIDVATETAIKESIDGTFNNELYVGTLENDGVGLAPFHEQEAEIDPEVIAAIEDLKAQIIAGSLKVG